MGLTRRGRHHVHRRWMRSRTRNRITQARLDGYITHLVAMHRAQKWGETMQRAGKPFTSRRTQ